MTSFVVETYLPRLSRADLRSLERRLERAAATVSRSGSPVKHLRSVHVPDDEACFHLFEAASPEGVLAAGRAAGIEFHRIAEALM